MRLGVGVKRLVASLLVFAAVFAPLGPAQADGRSWTGPYLGAGAGWRWADIDWTTTDIEYTTFGSFFDPTSAHASFDPSQFFFAAYGGYNLQLSSVVVGVDASITTGRDSKSSHGAIPGYPAYTQPSVDEISTELGAGGVVRARAGYLITPDLLLYAAGGVAIQEYDIRMSCPGSVGAPDTACNSPQSSSRSETKTGWTIGGGLEAMLGGNWIARVDYMFADFGSDKNEFLNTGLVPPLPPQPINAPDPAVRATSELQTHTLTVGIAYKF